MHIYKFIFLRAHIYKFRSAKQTNWTSSPVAYLLSLPSKSFSIADTELNQNNNTVSTIKGKKRQVTRITFLCILLLKANACTDPKNFHPNYITADMVTLLHFKTSIL
jgi:hypothetical protein